LKKEVDNLTESINGKIKTIIKHTCKVFCRNNSSLYFIIFTGRNFLFCVVKIGALKMIILITGATHTGKTALAQKLLEKYKYPYLSIDHLKMGLIRSGKTTLTPTSKDEDLTKYLWPIIREMIKTAIENNQNLIIEGCYIPFDWQKDFEQNYLEKIKYYCLVMSEGYIQNHFDDIKKYANVIENRLDDSGCTMEKLIVENKQILENAINQGLTYVLINDKYEIDVE
jgi:2-phosphoglycerate kinase